MDNLSFNITEEMEDWSALWTAPTVGDLTSVANVSDPVVDRSSVMKVERQEVVSGSVKVETQEVVDGSSCVVKVERPECEDVASVNCCIEKELKKVSLAGSADDLIDVNVNDEKGSKGVSEGGEISNRAESESATSSSSSSSSSEDDCDDEDGEEEKEEEEKGEEKREEDDVGQMEEGEIRDDNDNDEDDNENDDDDDDDDDDDVKRMVGWSDDDVVPGDDESGGGTEPIRSKNELKSLPPVPPVEVTLQLHHQTLPVGVVLSIVGAQVVVEGVEKHNPLNEGSILWITERRSPLGLVEEIFGPVKNPYYVVRYNSENEVPVGIQEGSPISFVPEFASHVLNDKNLYRKGYDASGENDEELSDDVEFSDDEKEAEYRRMKKMSKRGMNDQKLGNKDKKKVNNRDGNWKKDQPSALRAPTNLGPRVHGQDRHNASPIAAALDHRNNPCSFGAGEILPSGPCFAPQFPQLAQSTGPNPTPNGAWPNGMPCQQQQQQQTSSMFPNGFPAQSMPFQQQQQYTSSVFPNGFATQSVPCQPQPQQQQQQQHPSSVFPNGFPIQSMPWPQQGHLQNPYQMPLLNGMPFQQQQFNPSQGLYPNVVFPGGQPNFVAGPTYGPWSGLMGQSVLNPATFGMGNPQQFQNAGGQGFPSNMEQNQTVQPPIATQGNNQNPQQFNSGASFGRGRKPYRRGGGSFSGGRNGH